MVTKQLGFPGGSVGKESAGSAGDPDSIPGLGRSPGEGNGNPLQYSCLGNPRGTWHAAVHGVARVGHDLATKPATWQHPEFKLSGWTPETRRRTGRDEKLTSLQTAWSHKIRESIRDLYLFPYEQLSNLSAFRCCKFSPPTLDP